MNEICSPQQHGEAPLTPLIAPTCQAQAPGRHPPLIGVAALQDESLTQVNLNISVPDLRNRSLSSSR